MRDIEFELIFSFKIQKIQNLMKIGFQTEAKECVHFPFQNSFNILQYVLNSTGHSNMIQTNWLNTQLIIKETTEDMQGFLSLFP